MNILNYITQNFHPRARSTYWYYPDYQTVCLSVAFTPYSCRDTTPFLSYLHMVLYAQEHIPMTNLFQHCEYMFFSNEDVFIAPLPN